MELRSCADDVEIAVKAAGLEADGVDAVLVGLLRGLAAKIDRAGDEGPSDRVLAAYLSAQKDLARTVTARARAAVVAARSASPVDVPTADPSSPPKLHAVEVSPLDKLRNKKAANASGAVGVRPSSKRGAAADG